MSNNGITQQPKKLTDAEIKEKRRRLRDPNYKKEDYLTDDEKEEMKKIDEFFKEMKDIEKESIKREYNTKIKLANERRYEMDAENDKKIRDARDAEKLTE